VSDLSVEETISDLEKIVYRFYVKGQTIFLDSRSVMRRETKRHSFKVIMGESYSRLHSRDYGVKEEPEVDIDIQLQAIANLRKQINFKRWKNV